MWTVLRQSLLVNAIDLNTDIETRNDVTQIRTQRSPVDCTPRGGYTTEVDSNVSVLFGGVIGCPTAVATVLGTKRGPHAKSTSGQRSLWPKHLELVLSDHYITPLTNQCMCPPLGVNA